MLIMQCASDESLVPRYRRQDDSVFAPLQQSNNEGKSLIIRERQQLEASSARGLSLQNNNNTTERRMNVGYFLFPQLIQQQLRYGFYTQITGPVNPETPPVPFLLQQILKISIAEKFGDWRS